MDYRLPDDAVKRLIYQRIVRMAITYAFIFAIAMLVVFSRGIDPSPFILGFLGVVYAVMIVIAIFKMRRQMAALSISLTDDTISMAVPGLLASAVRRDEVTRIEERPGQGLAVHGRDKRVVGVPSMIGGYDEIRAALAQWRPIEPAVPSRGAWKRTLIVFGVIAGWSATYLLDDPRLVIPIGSLVVIGLLGSLVLIWRSKMLEVRYKLLMLMVLMPVLAIAVRVIEVARR